MHATSIQILILKYQFSLEKKQKKEFLEDMADSQSAEKKIKDEFRTSCTRKEGTAQ